MGERKELIGKALADLKAYFASLSIREKAILIGAAVVLGVIALNEIYASVTQTFAEQEQRLSTAKNDIETVALGLVRYNKLIARRQAIEDTYSKMEFSEGALSYLDKLVREKAGIVGGDPIKAMRPKPFAGKYEQDPFTIRFTITDLPRLVDFLFELVRGPRPMILASLDLKRRAAGDALEATMDVASIRKAKQGDS